MWFSIRIKIIKAEPTIYGKSMYENYLTTKETDLSSVNNMCVQPQTSSTIDIFITFFIAYVTENI